MKKRVLIYLFWIATALFVFSCKSDEPNMDLIHEDIVGEWTFSSTYLSGGFEIVKSLDGRFVIDKGATFKFKGITYVDDDYIDIFVDDDGLELGDIEFDSDEAYIKLRAVTYSSDFLRITSEYQIVELGNWPNQTSEDFEEIVTITRK